MKQDKTYKTVDKGWDKMNLILDHKMPQKKKRKILFWWLFGTSILATALIVNLIQHPQHNLNDEQINIKEDNIKNPTKSLNNTFPITQKNNTHKSKVFELEKGGKQISNRSEEQQIESLLKSTKAKTNIEAVQKIPDTSQSNNWANSSIPLSQNLNSEINQSKRKQTLQNNLSLKKLKSTGRTSSTSAESDLIENKKGLILTNTIKLTPVAPISPTDNVLYNKRDIEIYDLHNKSIEANNSINNSKPLVVLKRLAIGVGYLNKAKIPSTDISVGIGLKYGKVLMMPTIGYSHTLYSKQRQGIISKAEDSERLTLNQDISAGSNISILDEQNFTFDSDNSAAIKYISTAVNMQYAFNMKYSITAAIGKEFHFGNQTIVLQDQNLEFHNTIPQNEVKVLENQDTYFFESGISFNVSKKWSIDILYRIAFSNLIMLENDNTSSNKVALNLQYIL